MDQIARKFFQNESRLQLELGQDGLIGFLASNYIEILGTFRAIKKQNALTAEKKENAQSELEDLRNKQRAFKKLGAQIKDADWKELNAKMDYWKKIREEDDVVYYKGKPIRFNSYVEFIMKYPAVVEALDIIDGAARKPIGKGAGYASKIATWPLKKVVMFSVICMGVKGAGRDLAAGIYTLLESFPTFIEDKIANIDPGMTSGSNNPEYDDLKLQEVKIAY